MFPSGFPQLTGDVSMQLHSDELAITTECSFQDPPNLVLLFLGHPRESAGLRGGRVRSRASARAVRAGTSSGCALATDSATVAAERRRLGRRRLRKRQSSAPWRPLGAPAPSARLRRLAGRGERPLSARKLTFRSTAWKRAQALRLIDKRLRREKRNAAPPQAKQTAAAQPRSGWPARANPLHQDRTTSGEAPAASARSSAKDSLVLRQQGRERENQRKNVWDKATAAIAGSLTRFDSHDTPNLLV
jgi:hypothetical protein